ncbi:uncharacterized protein N7473_002591 [Penicillium subrubescens]|uniref:uncharacterized protein n=1 Tax=Penicillium subrubescens TaxID=1316194 RepID=UPI002545A4FD|nr:uncharacterized protein N7473_002591 [Penicillium subrubescens]KAJ5905675.1 hypothetical protein N7473_002591 [Penicillium subrubescens]
MPPWFRKGIDPGTIINFDQPVPSRWQIVQKLSEEDWQLTEAEYRRGERLSFAVTKLLCCNPKNPSTFAFMRIYLQVPYSGTEIDDADTRATQAATLIPRELLAYQDLTAQDIGCTPKLLGYKVSTQDNRGPVPGGFAVYLVWEKVPGVRLGNKDGSNEFWALDNAEREEIRQYFEKNLQAIRGIGYFPDTSALSSLVWDKNSKTLYFIGFRRRNIVSTAQTEPPPLDMTKRLAFFGLVEPNSRAWLKEGWDRDTTKWKW